MTHPIRIGSRGSQLALWQANHIAAQLRERGHAVEIEVIRTIGDRMQDPAFRAPQGIVPCEVGAAVATELIARGARDLLNGTYELQP